MQAPRTRVEIRNDLRPGDLGRVTALHGTLYAREHGFNHVFEAYVAESLAEFGKHYDPARDRLWVAERDGELLGSIGLVGRPDGQSQLRWLLVAPSSRGTGLGGHLLQICMDFARSAGYRSTYLWTVHTLEPAARLYRALGFELTQQLPESRLWGPSLSEQRYDLKL